MTKINPFSEAPADADPVADAAGKLASLGALAAETDRSIPLAEAAMSNAAEALADPTDADAEARFAQTTDALKALRARARVFEAKIIPEARQRLKAAQASATESLRLRRYLDAEEMARKAARALERDYPGIAARFVALLREISTARVAVLRANAELPEGFGPLADPESMVRDQPTRGRQILREDIVRIWSFPNGKPLSEEQASRVRPIDASRGSFMSRGTLASANGQPVQRLSFRRLEYLPELAWRPGSRIAGTLFPGLRVGDPDYWCPAPHLSPEAVDAMLNACAEPRPPLAPTVELIPLDGTEVVQSREPEPVASSLEAAL